jgi:hypothetical protein
MKIQWIVFIIVLITLAGVAGCAAPRTLPPATLSPATQMPPTQAQIEPPPATQIPETQSLVGEATLQYPPNPEIVLKMVERLNAGDVEGSLAYFAEDAMSYLVGFPPTGIEIYKGKEQIRSLWEDSVANHFEWEVEVISSNGDMVNIRAKTWHDFTRQLGIAPLEYIDVYEVKDGEILTYGSWLTEESLGRFKPAFDEVAPRGPTAAPPNDSPVSEMTVTIAGGTCTTDNPAALQAGEVTITLNVEDQDQSRYALTVFNLDVDKDILDLMVSTAVTSPSWADFLFEKELAPGESETDTFKLKEGPVYLICWSQPPDLPIGNSGPIAVVP